MNQKTDKWLLNIHLYAGLICSIYLIILGVSTIVFNHNMGPDQSQIPDITWEHTLEISVEGEDMKIATDARDALGLIGWPLPWEMQRDSTNDLRFGLARPGKYYFIHLDQTEKKIYVQEKRLGFTSVILALHGFSGELPGSTFMNIWSVFTEITTWVIFFSLISGVYFWIKRPKERKPGKIYLFVGLIFSVLLMLYILIIG